MLAHLRVGTREGDIHQCCLLSNSNIFSPLICSEASEGVRKKKMSRKHLYSNLFSGGDQWDEGPNGLLWQIHLLTFSGVDDLGFHNKSIGPWVCKFGWRSRGGGGGGGGCRWWWRRCNRGNFLLSLPHVVPPRAALASRDVRLLLLSLPFH